MRCAAWLAVLAWMPVSIVPARGLVVCHTPDGRAAVELAHGAGEHMCLAQPRSCCSHENQDAPGHDDENAPAESGSCLTDHGCVDDPVSPDSTTRSRPSEAPDLALAVAPPGTAEPFATNPSTCAPPHESPPRDPAVASHCIVLLT